MSKTNDAQQRKQTIVEELNKETAKMPWSQMQKFFASGSAIYVSAEFDLLDIASDLVMDNKVRIQSLIDQSKMHNVSDAQASAWIATDAELWTVVLAPYVLVQPIRTIGDH